MVSKSVLTVDDRDGSAANILQLTGTSLGSWATTAGITQPAVTFSGLRGELHLIGGVLDQFDVENTPVGVSKTTISSLGPAPEGGASVPAVYLMAKQANQDLEVTGNFSLFIGRRLNLDGTVDNVGDIAGVTNFVTLTTQNIFYNFQGDGRGTLVYDASNFAGGSQIVSVKSDAAYPGFGALVVDFSNSSRNKLIYAPNTELFVYDYIRGFGAQGNVVIDNRTAAAVHITENTLSQAALSDDVRVWAAFGPVYVQGRGAATVVTLTPETNTGDLRDTVIDDVTVTNAALKIVPDHPGTPIPGELPQVVLTDTQLTGLTGGTVYFANLVDYVVSSVTYPGLHIGLPFYGAASALILDTPSGVTTGINTASTVQIGPVTVLGTTGPLWLGRRNLVTGFNPNLTTFQADSVHIGDGSVQNIRGDIYLGYDGIANYSTPGGTTIDNSADSTPRDVAIAGQSFDAQVRVEGLAPATILMRSTINAVVDVLGNSGNHYTVFYAGPSTRLFAGADSTVDVLTPNGPGTTLPNLSIVGAGAVHVNAPQLNLTVASSPLQILADPARPDDITTLVADYSLLFSSEFWLDDAGAGMGRLSSGNPPNTPFSTTHILYQANRTEFTFLGQAGAFQQSQYPIHVLDTPAVHTAINAGTRIVDVQATTNPLEIHTPSASAVTLGSTGNMQALLGAVTIVALDAALPPTPIQLNDSADTVGRTVTLSYPEADHWTVAGLAPATIDVIGSRASVSVLGGSGDNTLVGPEAANTWVINATNGGKLNGFVNFSNVRNLQGGSLADDFNFIPGGMVTGNVDGDDGYDVLHYLNVLDGSEPIDLAAGIAPKIGGSALHIEAVDVVFPLMVQNPGNQVGRVGVLITPLAIATSQGSGTKSYSATGLPTGLAIDQQTGVISGTISSSLVPGTNFNVNVQVTDLTGTVGVSFVWNIQPAWTVINPGNQLSPEGVPINLPIQVDNPSNRPLTFSATGLPSGLSINSQTGAISGSIAFYYLFYHQNFTFPVQVAVSDATTSSFINFNWSTEQGFQVTAQPFVSYYAGETINAATISNPYGHSIAVIASGLPEGLSVNSSGQIIGTIADLAFQNSPYDVLLTVTDNTIGYAVPFTAQWNVLPGFDAYSPGDRTNYAGSTANLFVSIYNPFGHTISVQAAGLPSGLTIDNSGLISGTIDVMAANSTPYAVAVTVTDETIGYAIQVSFDWTIMPPLSLADLNFGTPAGTPFLAGILDPDVYPAPNQLYSITYSDLPGSPTSVYFVSNSQLLQFDGAELAPVVSSDPNHPSFSQPYNLMPVPGRGVLFLDGQSYLWLADANGARRISDDQFYLDDLSLAVAGDSVYLAAYDLADSQIKLFRLDFTLAGDPIVSHGDLTNVNNIRAFADGVLFTAVTADNNSADKLFWLDPATGVPVQLDASTANGAYHDFTITDATRRNVESLLSSQHPRWRRAARD